MSAGIAYELVPDVFTVRGGYNFGNNQVPDRNLSPAVCVIYEHHLSAGVGAIGPARHLQMDMAFTYALENKVTYTNLRHHRLGTKRGERPGRPPGGPDRRLPAWLARFPRVRRDFRGGRHLA